MSRGSWILFWLVPGVVLWFIIVWHTQIHEFSWRKPVLWFLLGRFLSLAALILLGSGGILLAGTGRASVIVIITAITLFIFITRELRNKPFTLIFKIMITWLVIDSSVLMLTVYLFSPTALGT